MVSSSGRTIIIISSPGTAACWQRKAQVLEEGKILAMWSRFLSCLHFIYWNPLSLVCWMFSAVLGAPLGNCRAVINCFSVGDSHKYILRQKYRGGYRQHPQRGSWHLTETGFVPKPQRMDQSTCVVMFLTELLSRFVLNGLYR